MAKTNYSEMEKSISMTLKKNKRDELLEKADEAQHDREAKARGEKLRKKAHTKKERAEATKEETTEKVINAIKKDLTRLSKKSKRVLFERIGIDREEMKKYIKDSSTLSRKEWETIKKIQDQISSYTKGLESVDEEFNDEIVKNERVKHINKRFNIKEGWMPL